MTRRGTVRHSGHSPVASPMSPPNTPPAAGGGRGRGSSRGKRGRASSSVTPGYTPASGTIRNHGLKPRPKEMAYFLNAKLPIFRPKSETQ